MQLLSGRFFIRLLLNAAALVFTAAIFKHIWLSGFMSAVVAAFILGIVNVFIRPALLLLTLPINIMTLGILTLFINALMFKLTSIIVPGFYIDGFWAAVGGSITYSILSIIINHVFNPLDEDDFPSF